MLKGIFAPNDEQVNDGNKSPRTIAIDQLNVESGYFATWSSMNQEHINKTQQIAALKQQHLNESLELDEDASNVLWETSFLPTVKALQDDQSLLEETRKKLETDKLKVSFD